MKRRKINDNELLKLIDEGVSRRDIAARFGCTQAAVSKRVLLLRPVMSGPLKVDKLTPKQKKFVVEMAKGSSQTAAAYQSHDCGSMGSAKSLGYRLMQQPEIKEALEEIREREIPLGYLVGRLRQHVDNHDPGVSLRAVDMGLKLHDAYPSAKAPLVSQEVTFIDLSSYQIAVQPKKNDDEAS